MDRTIDPSEGDLGNEPGGHLQLVPAEGRSPSAGSLSPLSDLEAPVTKYLLRYTPIEELVPAAQWEVIRDFTTQAAAEAAPLTCYEAKAIVSPLAQFVAWASMIGIPQDREQMFQRHLVERFADEVLKKRGFMKPGSRGNYRSVLYRVCEALGGPMAAPRRPTALTAASPSVPYTAKEQVAHRAMIGGQSTEYRNENLELLLALGYGAGLPTGDIAVLHGNHIIVVSEGVEVHVPGARPRIVPVLPEWENVVAKAAERAGADMLFLPRREGYKRNLLSKFVWDLDHGGATRLSTQRMRATWLVLHLNALVPFKDLMRAAGITDFDAVGRYIQFLDDPHMADAHAALRASGRKGSKS